MLKWILLSVLGFEVISLGVAPIQAQAQKKPNILVIWGDNIGNLRLSVGDQTPNIDSIAAQGALFTDWYGQLRSAAGRAAFITGQSPIRSGITGLPDATEGLRKADPTLAELLKPLGYATGQFGRNHLGDRNDMLPTVHGFDEWLSKSRAYDKTRDPASAAVRGKFGPRELLHCFATDMDHVAENPRFGGVGQQKCEVTLILTGRPAEAADAEITAGAIKFMTEAVKHQQQFFVWWNSSQIHSDAYFEKEHTCKKDLAIETKRLIEHDAQVGELLAALEALGIEDNTIVIYSSSNGVELFLWPDGGKKGAQWEGGYRVPTFIRWPDVIKAGTVINNFGAHEDMMPTLLAAAGDISAKEDLRKGRKIGEMTYKVHLDGYNLLPFLKGETMDWPRREFVYWTADGSVAAIRYDERKLTFLRHSAGTVWELPFEELPSPLLTNLHMDHSEPAPDRLLSYDSAGRRIFKPALAVHIGQWLQSFREFPPRQKSGRFPLDRAMEVVTTPPKG